MVKELHEATAEFITERVNYHGTHLTTGASEAFDDFDQRMKELGETLTEPQKVLLLEMETAHSDAFGEIQRFYFEAGFGDAIRFVLAWGKHANQ